MGQRQIYDKHQSPDHHTVYSQACDGVVAAERDPPPGGSVVATDEARVSVAVHSQTGVV